MISVIVNAYACSPGMGSEPGMAWNWCVNLANYCELHIITEGEFKEKIESSLVSIPQSKNMHFYYNPVSNEVRQMCWTQGDWRFYSHYRRWQYKAYEIATDIVKKEKIDILHQLNMIGFREPGYLWKIEGIPFVWGPVDAKEKFPVTYLAGAELKTKIYIYLKNFLTYLQLQFSKRVRDAVKKASVVISASSNSQASFNKFFNIISPLINETGCYIQDSRAYDRTQRTKLDVLWVGKLDFRKQLGIAIRALSEAKNININLHIIGGGDSLHYKQLASSLLVAPQCIWYGVVSHEKVQQIMQNSDLFFFTSVAEGTPHVVLEAISNNIPVLCFDTCGQGDSVDEEIGRKIKLSNPKQSIKDFAEQLNFFASHPEVLKKMSLNCKVRQIELSWDAKARRVIELYDKISYGN